MGLRRRLSKKWNETVNGVLSGPGVDVDSVNTDKGTINHGLIRGRSGERIDASQFDGADVDARLDAAISSASDGGIIYLEKGTYTDTRTINTKTTFVGTSQTLTGSGSLIDADWTIDSSVTLDTVVSSGTSSITVNAQQSAIFNSGISNTVTVNADEFRYVGNIKGSVTFDSTSSSGIVDACVFTTVTDNGSNTVGDIA